MFNNVKNFLTADPLISVVLCTYNDEETIALTISSVLEQSFTDFEFIIWNDGSTDSTEEIVKSYDDPRIRYYYHENSGPGLAAKLACEKVRGKYIARIDGDDIALPQRLQKEALYMENHPECVLVSSAVKYIGEGENEIGRSFPYTWNAVLKKILNYNSPFVHPSCMFRTRAYAESKGYPSTRCFVDSIMFKRLKEKGKVHNISEPLLKYRLSSSSTSHSLGKYVPVLRELEKLIVDEKAGSDELEVLFNNVYMIAKKNSIQQRVFYRDGYLNHCYRLLSYIMPSSIAERIIIFVHNIYGLLRYL